MAGGLRAARSAFESLTAMTPAPIGRIVIPLGRIAPAVVILAALGGPAAASPCGPRDDLSAQDCARVAAVTAPPQQFDRAQPFEASAGGAATLRGVVGPKAFTHPSANLAGRGHSDFFLGDALFNKAWASSPASTHASDGLGPLFNARACQSCHVRDGRGHPPGPDDRALSMFLRLSVPPRTEAERAAIASLAILRIPEPTYGGQLQEFATPGLAAEGRMQIAYEEFSVSLSGGETATLRRPTYTIAHPGYGPLDEEVMISPRVAPPLIGLGLLEAIHPADIEARADPDDADGDGVSGRVSRVDPAGAIGRFGWKASSASLRAQSASAFSGDIGISTPDRPAPHGDCTARQTACRHAPNGVQARLGDTEAPAPVLDLVTHYTAHLAVPARRDVDDGEVLRGKAAFHAAGCAACHTPSFVTARDAARPEHQFQLIWPYTDLLLHDMGEGLADHRPVGTASGREWRTAPLWGVGLTETVSGHSFLLHDGRARSLLEAVLWHGGEAQAARDAVIAMPPDARAALIRFLESL